MSIEDIKKDYNLNDYDILDLTGFEVEDLEGIDFTDTLIFNEFIKCLKEA